MAMPPAAPHVPLHVVRGIYGIVHELLLERDLAVFLVGKGIDDGCSLRAQLRTALEAHEYRKERVQVWYPEQLFRTLFFKSRRLDLLSLENRLASNVDVVLIVVESAGSICELGAFCNSENLRKRLVAVIDRNRRSDRSFIMGGPVRLLQKEPGTHVLSHPFNAPVDQNLRSQVVRAVREMGRNEGMDTSPGNPIVGVLLALAVVYVAEPLSRVGLRNAFAAADGAGLRQASESVEVALEYLLSQEEIRLQQGAYGLTAKGIGRVHRLISEASRYADLREALDRCRVGMLNRMLRRGNG